MDLSKLRGDNVRMGYTHISMDGDSCEFPSKFLEDGIFYEHILEEVVYLVSNLELDVVFLDLALPMDDLV